MGRARVASRVDLAPRLLGCTDCRHRGSFAWQLPPARVSTIGARREDPETLRVHTILNAASNSWKEPDDPTTIGRDLCVSFQNEVFSTGEPQAPVRVHLSRCSDVEATRWRELKRSMSAG